MKEFSTEAHDLAGFLVMGANADTVSEIAERLFEAIFRNGESDAERLVAIAHVAAMAIMYAGGNGLAPDLLRRAFDDLTAIALRTYPEVRDAPH